MKAFTAVKVLGAMAVLGGIAGRVAIAEDATASAGVDVASAYIFRGGTVNDEVNVQPTLEGTFYGATLGTWANYNTDSSQFDEIDLYASYTLPLGDAVPFDVSVGYTEYTYPTATDEAGAGLEADREVNVGLSHELAINDQTTLSSSLSGNFGIEGPYLDQGVNITLDESIGYTVDENVSLSVGATGAYEAGDNFADTGFSYVQLNAGVSYSALNLGVHYVIETDKDVLTVDEDFWGSVGLSLPL